SRRRHTRLVSDWSSDVCSSDLRSTEKAARLGDARWTKVMSHYYAAVRKELKSSRGKEVVTTGDGLLATFKAPAAGIGCATAIREIGRASCREEGKERWAGET